MNSAVYLIKVFTKVAMKCFKPLPTSTDLSTSKNCWFYCFFTSFYKLDPLLKLHNLKNSWFILVLQFFVKWGTLLRIVLFLFLFFVFDKNGAISWNFCEKLAAFNITFTCTPVYWTWKNLPGILPLPSLLSWCLNFNDIL